MALGKIVNEIFGGGNVKFKPAPLSGGGFKGRGGEITSTPERLGLVGDIAATFPEQAEATGGLLQSVAPGFSDLRRARLSEIDTARSSAIGNLRENLARRRVLGSSFGEDALARAEAEFGQQRERVQAESFLQELDLTNQLIQQQFQQRRGEFQTSLDNLNLEASIASGLAAKVTEQLGENARLNAAMAFKSAEGLGQLIGRVGSASFPTVQAAKPGASGFFGGLV